MVKHSGGKVGSAAQKLASKVTSKKQKSRARNNLKGAPRYKAQIKVIQSSLECLIDTKEVKLQFIVLLAAINPEFISIPDYLLHFFRYS